MSNMSLRSVREAVHRGFACSIEGLNAVGDEKEMNVCNSLSDIAMVVTNRQGCVIFFRKFVSHDALLFTLY